MTRSRVVRKSLNPLLWQTWVFGWYLILRFRYKLADHVNARSESFARWIRWPLGAGRPDRWREVHVIRVGGIGDSLMSTSCSACSSRSGPIFESFSIAVRAALPGPALSRRGSAPRGLLPPLSGDVVSQVAAAFGTPISCVDIATESSNFSTKDRSLLGGISPESSAISSAWLWATFALPASLTRH